MKIQRFALAALFLLGTAATGPAAARPTLALDLTADAELVFAGEAAGYTLTVSNAGKGKISPALTGLLPAGGDLSWSMSPQVPDCTVVSSTLSCSFSRLAAGNSISVHVVSATTPASCGTHTASASADAKNAAVQGAGPVDIVVHCPPVPVILEPIEGSTTGPDVSVLFAGSDPAADAFACALDGLPVSACAPGVPAQLAGLTEGFHTFTVDEIDAFGATGSASVTWRVDATPPSITFVPPTPEESATTGPIVRVQFSSSEPAELSCELDGSSIPCVSDAPVELPELVPGAHSFTVLAVDEVGNAAIASRNWTVATPTVACTDWAATLTGPVYSVMQIDGAPRWLAVMEGGSVRTVNACDGTSGDVRNLAAIALTGIATGTMATGPTIYATGGGALHRLPVDPASGALGPHTLVDLRRTDCTFDEVAGVAVHVRATATDDFKTRFAGDVVYVTTRYADACGPGRNRVFALDGETLVRHWVYNETGGTDFVGPAAGAPVVHIASDRLYVATSTNASLSADSLWSFNARTILGTGALAWATRGDSLVVPPVVVGDAVYVATGAGAIRRHNRIDGSMIWSTLVTGSVAHLTVDPVNPAAIAVVTATGELRMYLDLGTSAIALAPPLAPFDAKFVTEPVFARIRDGVEKLYFGTSNGIARQVANGPFVLEEGKTVDMGRSLPAATLVTVVSSGAPQLRVVFGSSGGRLRSYVIPWGSDPGGG